MKPKPDPYNPPYTVNEKTASRPVMFRTVVVSAVGTSAISGLLSYWFALAITVNPWTVSNLHFALTNVAPVFGVATLFSLFVGHRMQRHKIVASIFVAMGITMFGAVCFAIDILRHL